ncbi:MAG: ATP-binding protein [Anaerolineae bacterium]
MAPEAGTSTVALDPPQQMSVAPLQSGELDLRGLLRPTLRRIATGVLFFSYSWAVFVFFRYDYASQPTWLRLTPAFLLFATALLALMNLQRHAISTSILVTGLGAAAMVDLVLSQARAGGWSALAAILVAGVLAGPAWSSLCALALGLISAFLPVAWPEKWSVIREALFGVALMWAVGSSIFQALVHAEASELRSWHHAREAMKRRGELQRTSKALRDMYALLERTNHELEVARREAEEAKEIKARFAANISHELRTPLNLIMGFSHTMYSSPEVYGDMRWPPELRMDIHEIYSASRHLLGMIDDILDLSRIEAQRLPLKLESTNLVTLINEAAATGKGLLRGSSVSLAVRVPTDLPEVLVDRTRIRQVLLNLLSNAIRFTDAGEVRVEAQLGDGEVEVTVADTGMGIPAEDLPTIFDEFSQAKGPITSGRGGAGLGLAVCKQFVQLHGGRITVESEVGKGSTFRFTIPLPGAGRARSRLVYYTPDGWSPPLPGNSLGKSVVVLAPNEASAKQVARGIAGYRAIPMSELDSLKDIIESEHPAGIVLVKDPLTPHEGPTAESVWAISGRPDLGVIEYEMPIESLAKRHLQVEAYMPKPVQAEHLLAVIRESGARPEKFLIVDDDPGFRTLMERVLLAAFPFSQVQPCSNGESALEILERERFDVLILDVLMPELGGIDFLFLARQKGLLAEAKVIVTTGASYADELAKAYPIRLVLSKKAPPRGSEWLNCITALLDAAPPDYSLSC